MWLDYDLKNRKPRDYFYMSNFAPLWTRGYRRSTHEVSRHVLNYLDEYNIDDFIGEMINMLNMIIRVIRTV